MIQILLFNVAILAILLLFIYSLAWFRNVTKKPRKPRPYRHLVLSGVGVDTLDSAPDDIQDVLEKACGLEVKWMRRCGVDIMIRIPSKTGLRKDQLAKANDDLAAAFGKDVRLTPLKELLEINPKTFNRFPGISAGLSLHVAIRNHLKKLYSLDENFLQQFAKRNGERLVRAGISRIFDFDQLPSSPDAPQFGIFKQHLERALFERTVRKKSSLGIEPEVHHPDLNPDTEVENLDSPSEELPVVTEDLPNPSMQAKQSQKDKDNASDTPRRARRKPSEVTLIPPPHTPSASPKISPRPPPKRKVPSRKQRKAHKRKKRTRKASCQMLLEVSRKSYGGCLGFLGDARQACLATIFILIIANGALVYFSESNPFGETQANAKESSVSESTRGPPVPRMSGLPMHEWMAQHPALVQCVSECTRTWMEKSNCKASDLSERCKQARVQLQFHCAQHCGYEGENVT